jgi:hypothetical protein
LSEMRSRTPAASSALISARMRFMVFLYIARPFLSHARRSGPSGQTRTCARNRAGRVRNEVLRTVETGVSGTEWPSAAPGPAASWPVRRPSDHASMALRGQPSPPHDDPERIALSGLTTSPWSACPGVVARALPRAFQAWPGYVKDRPLRGTASP